MSNPKSTIRLGDLYQRYLEAQNEASTTERSMQPVSLHALLGAALDLPEGEQLQFMIPDTEQWASLAVTLLKFEFPPHLLAQVYKRFAIQWLANARANKKYIHLLSLPALEWLLQQLCLIRYNATLNSADVALQAWLMKIEISEFQLQRLVESDIAYLAEDNTSRLHSFYYQGKFDLETLKQLLCAHGFENTSHTIDTRCFDLPEAQNNPMAIYWLVRRLAYPLPWKTLIDAFENESSLFTRLKEQQPLLDSMVTFYQAFYQESRLSNFKNHPAFSVSSFLEGFSTNKISKEQQSWTLKDFSASRETLWAKRPYQRVILVEGTTEAILLPLLSRLYDCYLQQSGLFEKNDLQKNHTLLETIAHTLVLPVGGKNQMLATYKTFAQELDIPVFILLDKDALSIQQQVQSVLRERDSVILLEQGEIEDLYSRDFLISVINNEYRPHPELTSKLYQEIIKLRSPLLDNHPGVQKPVGRVAELKLIWQVLGLGRFDKVVLAQQLAEVLATLLITMSRNLESDQVELNLQKNFWNPYLPDPIRKLIADLYGKNLITKKNNFNMEQASTVRIPSPLEGEG